MLHATLLLACSLAAGPPQDLPTLVADLDPTPAPIQDFGNAFAIRGEALGLLWMDGERDHVDSMAWTLAASGEEPQPFVIPESEYGPGFYSEFDWVRDLGNGRALLSIGTASITLAPRVLFGTDGTPQGTLNLGLHPASKVTIDSYRGNQPPIEDGVAYLRGWGADGIYGVYRTDGTPAGTWRLAPTAQSVVTDLWKLGPRLVGADVVLTGQGTTIFSVPAVGGAPEVLTTSPIPATGLHGTVLAGRLLFGHRGEPDLQAQFGTELWATDGTRAGTGLLVDLDPGPGSSVPQFLGSDGQRAFFSASTPATGRELWWTDGTAAGTAFVADVAPGAASGLPGTREAAAPLGAGLVFRGSANASDFEPWFSDGSAAGTHAIADLSSAPGGGLPLVPLFEQPFFALGDRVGFGAVPEGLGREPCITDGVTVTVLGDLHPGATGSFPRDFVAFDDRAFFAADSPVGGVNPWSAGLAALDLQQETPIDLQQATQDSSPRGLVVGAGRGFFTADNPGDAQELLYATDGTAAGTLAIEGPAQRLVAEGVLDERLIYFRETEAAGLEPYVTDGSPGAGLALGDLNPGPAPGVRPDWGGAQLGRHYYFAIQTPLTGYELGRTDGTPAGTGLYSELNPGQVAGLTEPMDALVVAGRLFFRGLRTPGPSTLWSTDGGPGGARPVAPQLIGGKTLRAFCRRGDELAICASVGADFQVLILDPESLQATPLYAAGGIVPFGGLSSVGQRLVLILAPPPLGSASAVAVDELGGVEVLIPESLGAAQVQLLAAAPGGSYLRLDSDDAGVEGTWFTDGTAAGTRRVAGPADGALLAGSGEELLLSLCDPPTGQELWVTDGTLGGTRLVADAEPGFGGSDPEPLGTVGGRCLFSAFSFAVGEELHALPLPEVGGYLARPFGQGCGLGPGPELSVAGALRVGGGVELRLGGLAPGQPAGIYLSLGVGAAPSGACSVYLTAPVPLGLTPLDAAGSGAIGVSIPAEPALVGLEAYLQGASAIAGGPLLGAFELTNGVELVFGP